MADARASRRRHRHGDRLRRTDGRGPDRLLRPDQTARDDQRRPGDRPLNQWQVLQDSRVPQNLDAAVEPDSSTGSPANTEKTRRTTTAGPTRHAGPQVEQRTDRRTPEATSRMTCPKCTRPNAERHKRRRSRAERPPRGESENRSPRADRRFPSSSGTQLNRQTQTERPPIAATRNPAPTTRDTPGEGVAGKGPPPRAPHGGASQESKPPHRLAETGP